MCLLKIKLLIKLSKYFRNENKYYLKYIILIDIEKICKIIWKIIKKLIKLA